MAFAHKCVQLKREEEAYFSIDEEMSMLSCFQLLAQRYSKEMDTINREVELDGLLRALQLQKDVALAFSSGENIWRTMMKKQRNGLTHCGKEHVIRKHCVPARSG